MTETRPDPISAPPETFFEEVRALGVEFDEGDVERLGTYLRCLRAGQERFNLTAITEAEAMWTRHVLDSLTLVPLLASLGAKTVADVGSGGGLPGVVLAVVMSDVEFTLVEATGKKAAFLTETLAALGATNARVVNERAETIGRDRETHRERYDAVVARAVGRLPVLLELTVPLARVGGCVLAIKGGRAAEEIADSSAALRALKCSVADTRRTSTGTIVIVAKDGPTPKRYPRRPGEPKKDPISA
jgi:16S rRNA (guanine527-N7)-methyltransferase